MSLHVNKMQFSLAFGQNLEGLKERITRALHSGGAFVDFRVTGDVFADVMITPHSQVAIVIDPGSRAGWEPQLTDMSDGDVFDEDYWTMFD